MARPCDGSIIDLHHHLWDCGFGRRPWLAPQAGGRGDLGDLAPLGRDYLRAGEDGADQPEEATVAAVPLPLHPPVQTGVSAHCHAPTSARIG